MSDNDRLIRAEEKWHKTYDALTKSERARHKEMMRADQLERDYKDTHSAMEREVETHHRSLDRLKDLEAECEQWRKASKMWEKRYNDARKAGSERAEKAERRLTWLSPLVNGDAQERIAELEAERDALRAEVEDYKQASESSDAWAEGWKEQYSKEIAENKRLREALVEIRVNFGWKAIKEIIDPLVKVSEKEWIEFDSLTGMGTNDKRT